MIYSPSTSRKETVWPTRLEPTDVIPKQMTNILAQALQESTVGTGSSVIGLLAGSYGVVYGLWSREFSFHGRFGTRDPERMEPFNAAKILIMAAMDTALAPTGPKILPIISPATRVLAETSWGAIT